MWQTQFAILLKIMSRMDFLFWSYHPHRNNHQQKEEIRDLGLFLFCNTLSAGNTPILEKNALRMQGQMKIFHVGSDQFRESLRELLQELWSLY